MASYAESCSDTGVAFLLFKRQDVTEGVLLNARSQIWKLRTSRRRVVQNEAQESRDFRIARVAREDGESIVDPGLPQSKARRLDLHRGLHLVAIFRFFSQRANAPYASFKSAATSGRVAR